MPGINHLNILLNHPNKLLNIDIILRKLPRRKRREVGHHFLHNREAFRHVGRVNDEIPRHALRKHRFFIFLNGGQFFLLLLLPRAEPILFHKRLLGLDVEDLDGGRLFGEDAPELGEDLLHRDFRVEAAGFFRAFGGEGREVDRFADSE